MIGGQPAFYFTHFWRRDPALELASVLQNALAAQKEAEEVKAHRWISPARGIKEGTSYSFTG